MQSQEGRFASGHFGPEVTFSRKLKEAGYKPAIFKYTRGSTSIHSDWLAPEEGGYYDAMVADLDTAITDLESQGHTVNIRGFIWIQGESDAETHALASAYETTLELLEKSAYQKMKIDRYASFDSGQGASAPKTLTPRCRAPSRSLGYFPNRAL